MAGQRQNYNRGNYAVLLNEDFYGNTVRKRREVPEERPALKTNAKPVIKTKEVKTKTAVKPQVRTKPHAGRKGVFSTLLIIISCFGLFAFIIARYSIICATGSQITDLKDGIAKMQQEANTYQVQISEKMDMGYIQDTAKEKLGMDFPAADQIEYVDLESEKQVAAADNGQNQVSKGDEKNINVLSEFKNALE